MKPLFYTFFALLAFAGNSVFCRMALGAGQIDATGFTIVRLCSALVMLFVLHALIQVFSSAPPQPPAPPPSVSARRRWLASCVLFVYAAGFSFAYVSLDTGTGALILFACVQITMLMYGVLKGQKPSIWEYCGMVLACVGLVYLLLPSLQTPSLMGFVLMSVAGVAWAIYTLLGHNSHNPLQDTYFNFVRTSPFCLIMLLVWLFLQTPQFTSTGLWLAILSGAVASGLGYAVWYLALPKLSSISAAVLQLLVPVLAAAGGVLFVNELLSIRFVMASLLVLGGVLATLIPKFKTYKPPSSMRRG